MSVCAKMWFLKANKAFAKPRWLNSNSSATTEHTNPSCITTESANKQNSWIFSQSYQITRIWAKCKDTSFVIYFVIYFLRFFFLRTTTNYSHYWNQYARKKIILWQINHLKTEFAALYILSMNTIHTYCSWGW